jgi:hypothetical protein
MEFVRGNRAVRNHAKDGKDLHLFEALGNRKGYRYMGVFACSSWEYSQGEDLKGNERRAIVFHLIRPEGSAPTADAADVGMPDQLRRRALEAGSQAVQKTPREAKRLFYERSAAVREYVLRRAEGTCEACGTKAPFRMTDAPLTWSRIILADSRTEDPTIPGGLGLCARTAIEKFTTGRTEMKRTEACNDTLRCWKVNDFDLSSVPPVGWVTVSFGRGYRG